MLHVSLNIIDETAEFVIAPIYDGENIEMLVTEIGVLSPTSSIFQHKRRERCYQNLNSVIRIQILSPTLSLQHHYFI